MAERDSETIAEILAAYRAGGATPAVHGGRVAANGAGGVIFIILAPVSWPHALVLAVASLVGGRLGAALGMRVPERPLRVGIAVFGLLVAARLAVNVHLF